MMLLGERKTGVHVTGEKLISWGKGENQQQTQPTHGIDAYIWNRATLVGGGGLSPMHHPLLHTKQ